MTTMLNNTSKFTTTNQDEDTFQSASKGLVASENKGKVKIIANLKANHHHHRTNSDSVSMLVSGNNNGDSEGN